MKMKKLLRMVMLISLVLFSTSVLAMTVDDYRHKHEVALTQYCEDDWEAIEKMDARDAYNLIDFPSHYECGLTQFYALHSIIEYQLYIDRQSEDWGVLMEIMEQNYLEDFDTYDFVNIDIQFGYYLEDKDKN